MHLFPGAERMNEAQFCAWASPRGHLRRPELKEFAFGKGIAVIVVCWGKMPFLCKP